MSKHINNLNRVIEFARANGFPEAHGNHWDRDSNEPVLDFDEPPEWGFVEGDEYLLGISLGAYVGTRLKVIDDDNTEVVIEDL